MSLKISTTFGGFSTLLGSGRNFDFEPNVFFRRLKSFLKPNTLKTRTFKHRQKGRLPEKASGLKGHLDLGRLKPKSPSSAPPLEEDMEEITVSSQESEQSESKQPESQKTENPSPQSLRYWLAQLQEPDNMDSSPTPTTTVQNLKDNEEKQAKDLLSEENLSSRFAPKWPHDSNVCSALVSLYRDFSGSLPTSLEDLSEINDIFVLFLDSEKDALKTEDGDFWISLNDFLHDTIDWTEENPQSIYDECLEHFDELSGISPVMDTFLAHLRGKVLEKLCPNLLSEQCHAIADQQQEIFYYRTTLANLLKLNPLDPRLKGNLFTPEILTTLRQDVGKKRLKKAAMAFITLDQKQRTLNKTLRDLGFEIKDEEISTPWNEKSLKKLGLRGFECAEIETFARQGLRNGQDHKKAEKALRWFRRFVVHNRAARTALKELSRMALIWKGRDILDHLLVGIGEHVNETQHAKDEPPFRLEREKPIFSADMTEKIQNFYQIHVGSIVDPMAGDTVLKATLNATAQKYADVATTLYGAVHLYKGLEDGSRGLSKKQAEKSVRAHFRTFEDLHTTRREALTKGTNGVSAHKALLQLIRVATLAHWPPEEENGNSTRYNPMEKYDEICALLKTWGVDTTLFAPEIEETLLLRLDRRLLSHWKKESIASNMTSKGHKIKKFFVRSTVPVAKKGIAPSTLNRLFGMLETLQRGEILTLSGSHGLTLDSGGLGEVGGQGGRGALTLNGMGLMDIVRDEETGEYRVALKNGLQSALEGEFLLGSAAKYLPVKLRMGVGFVAKYTHLEGSTFSFPPTEEGFQNLKDFVSELFQGTKETEALLQKADQIQTTIHQEGSGTLFARGVARVELNPLQAFKDHITLEIPSTTAAPSVPEKTTDSQPPETTEALNTPKPEEKKEEEAPEKQRFGITPGLGIQATFEATGSGSILKKRHKNLHAEHEETIKTLSFKMGAEAQAYKRLWPDESFADPALEIGIGVSGTRTKIYRVQKDAYGHYTSATRETIAPMLLKSHGLDLLEEDGRDEVKGVLKTLLKEKELGDSLSVSSQLTPESLAHVRRLQFKALHTQRLAWEIREALKNAETPEEKKALKARLKTLNGNRTRLEREAQIIIEERKNYTPISAQILSQAEVGTQITPLSTGYLNLNSSGQAGAQRIKKQIFLHSPHQNVKEEEETISSSEGSQD